MKFLVIQTAFIGDVILATPLVEKLRRFYPDAQIDFLLRKGNEKLLAGHPYIRRVWVWDKKRAKYRGLAALIRQIRQEHYDEVINCQRFAAAGLLTVCSGARRTAGFRKNPLSLFFTRRVPHKFGTVDQPVHEVQRNLTLIGHLTDASFEMPRLYPAPADYERVRALKSAPGRYVCIAPTSVWFTKQFPAHKWLELMALVPADCAIYLLGGPEDAGACAAIQAASGHPEIYNLAGRLSLLESAALLQGAEMNYVNDSAPMHLASAVNAPVAAVFCSTVPLFGFTPLSEQSRIVETKETLGCRPCGLHGRPACPLGHFACAETIVATQFPLPR
ncbi:MAG: glycosyltransferase family 9 protein [Thermoanaerobaculia bacterium]|nr:glycosyltransferase family 9 protein [Thermoanaerobaculia bacterium]